MRTGRRAALAALLLLVLLGAMFALDSRSTQSAPGDKVYWIVDDAISRANLDGTNQEQVLVDVGAWDLEIDSASGKMYWSNLQTREILRANLDGTSIEHLIADPDVVRFALDLTNDQLYWTSVTEIRRANLDGSSEEVVLEINETVRSLDVYPANDTIFFATERVYLANLDGTGQQVFSEPHFGVLPLVDVAVDEVNGDFYWIDWEIIASPGALCATGYSFLREGLNTQPMSPAVSVAAHGGDVYWGGYEVFLPLPFCSGGSFGRDALMRGGAVLVDGISPTGIAVALGDAPPLPTPTAGPLAVGGIARSTGLAPLPAAEESAGSATPWFAVAALAVVGVALGVGLYARRRRLVG